MFFCDAERLKKELPQKNFLESTLLINIYRKNMKKYFVLTISLLLLLFCVQPVFAQNTETITVTNNGKSVTFKMIRVEAGTFQMGDANSFDNEKPIHSVILTNDY